MLLSLSGEIHQVVVVISTTGGVDIVESKIKSEMEIQVKAL
jgi:hypothetical protein